MPLSMESIKKWGKLPFFTSMDEAFNKLFFRSTGLISPWIYASAACLASKRAKRETMRFDISSNCDNTGSTACFSTLFMFECSALSHNN